MLLILTDIYTSALLNTADGIQNLEHIHEKHALLKPDLANNFSALKKCRNILQFVSRATLLTKVLMPSLNRPIRLYTSQTNIHITYYHFRSTLKRDDFFAYVYFSNLTVLSGYVSRLTNETLAVMLRN